MVVKTEDRMPEKWFRFGGYNLQPLYGFGTADEASRFQDILNAKRDINHYEVVALDESEVAGLRLDDSDLGFNLDDELRDRD